VLGMGFHEDNTLEVNFPGKILYWGF